MDRTQRKPSDHGHDDTSAPAHKPGAGDTSSSRGPVQMSPAPAGAGAGASAGAWEADDSLMSAMGMVDAPVQRKRVEESPVNVEAAASAGLGGGSGAVPHQAQMESAFGTSFGGVNAHTGPQAADACDAMGAQAYATGNNVAFKKADPEPALVAHELTHVLQQRGGVQGKGAGESTDLEAEADSVGARVAGGQSVADVTAKYTGGGGGGSGVQRSPAPEAESAEAEDDEKQDAAPAAKPTKGADDDAADEDEAKTPAKGKGKGKGGDDKKPKDPEKQGEQAKTEDPAAHESESDTVQMARDTTWGGNFVQVDKPPRLIGNVTPGHTGGYTMPLSSSVRLLYLNDTTGGLDGPDGNVFKKGYKVNSGKGVYYSAGLPHTKPGTWKAWMHNPGGWVADSMHAEESFSVVAPVKMGARKSKKELKDFQNPIPIQMTGDSEMKLKLSSSMVHAKRLGISAGGSTSEGTTEKMSFGLKIGLDNDAGSEGAAAWGMSAATSHEFKRQWNAEEYSGKEITAEKWQEYKFHPEAKEKGRSKMLVPIYEWVEWGAEVYPHNPATLETTGDKKDATYGLLIPTGRADEMMSTDPGINANSLPTKDAEIDPRAKDAEFLAQQPSAQGWRTLSGAKWADDGATYQFIKGPIVNDFAERDYGAQGGSYIGPGNGTESLEEGQSFSVSTYNGISGSSSKEDTHVNTNNESKSLEAAPGIKGIGSVGSSLSFENEGSVGASTGTGLSSDSSTKQASTVAVTHTVTKKKTQNQFIAYTPLVTHKVFEVGWGSRKPATGNTVDPYAAQTGFVHTYQHTAVPHVKVFDIPKKSVVKVGKDGDYKQHVEV